MSHQMALIPDPWKCGLRMPRECRERFPQHRLKTLVSHPGMRTIPGSPAGGGGENIPGACATRDLTDLVRGPWNTFCGKDSFWQFVSICMNTRRVCVLYVAAWNRVCGFDGGFISLHYFWLYQLTLQWRHNERDGVSNYQPRDCLLKRFVQAEIKENIRVTGPCERNSPVTGEFPT